MKVSIIIPVYNAEKHLACCLDSLLEQSYEDYEIICVDDQSNDASLQILESYRSVYPNTIRVLSNPINSGAGQSRNNGIQYAQGEYLLFVDSDDHVASNYLETYTRAMQDDPCDILVGGFVEDREGKLTRHPVSHSVWSITTYPAVWAKLWNKNFILENDIRFGTTTCAEDTFFSLSAFINNATYRVIDYEGYFYYQNPNSAIRTTDYSQDHERMMAKVFTDLMDLPEYEQITTEQRQILSYTYLANMVDSLMNYNRGCGTALMSEKYEFILNDLSRKFPGYLKNPYIGFFKPEGQTRIIRLGVAGFRLLRKLRLDKLFFSFVARR